MNRKFRSFIEKLKSPFNNRKGVGFPQLILIMLGSTLVVGFVSWLLMLTLHSRIESAARSICYNIVDGIAESGTLSASMQTEFYKGFNNLKYYTGDYEVKYYKYDYSGGNFSKVLLGTSKNGAIISSFTITKDTTIQVTFKSSDDVPLDKISQVLGSSNGAGLAVGVGGKVD